MQNPPLVKKPLDILQYIIAVAMIDGGKRWRSLGPGKIIERLSDEKREVLSQLTSEDTQNQYVPWYHLHDEEYENNKRFSKLKQKFDNQCSRSISF